MSLKQALTLKWEKGFILPFLKQGTVFYEIV